MSERHRRAPSPLLRVLEVDDSLPIEREAVALWLADVDRPTRWTLRPLLQLLLAATLHAVWFLKRLPLPQFSAHRWLQSTICWFCRWFVTPEANRLILRHFAVESNILNFLRDNCPDVAATPVDLYPECIEDMHEASFVEHDQALFRLLGEIGAHVPEPGATALGDLSWGSWRPVRDERFRIERHRSQILDFETSHALFMCLFCLLLTAEEYRDAINGFNLDHSIAVRVGALIGEPGLESLAYNRFPLYLVGPWNLSQRFLMHGFFTEHLYARLERLRLGLVSGGAA